MAGVRTPRRAPNANAVGERIVRTIRTECLDHLIVFDERHLRAVLAEFADYYNRDRPHRSLGWRVHCLAALEPMAGWCRGPFSAVCTTSTLEPRERGRNFAVLRPESGWSCGSFWPRNQLAATVWAGVVESDRTFGAIRALVTAYARFVSWWQLPVAAFT